MYIENQLKGYGFWGSVSLNKQYVISTDATVFKKNNEFGVKYEYTINKDWIYLYDNTTNLQIRNVHHISYKSFPLNFVVGADYSILNVNSTFLYKLLYILQINTSGSKKISSEGRICFGIYKNFVKNKFFSLSAFFNYYLILTKYRNIENGVYKLTIYNFENYKTLGVGFLLSNNIFIQPQIQTSSNNSYLSLVFGIIMPNN